VLALARDRRADDAPEEGADRARRPDREPGRDHPEAQAPAPAAQPARPPDAPPRAGDAAREAASDEGEDGDPADERHEPQVQLRVRVEEVRELVGDDALQLVPGERLERAARHRHDGAIGREPRREGVDPRLAGQDVDGRHRQAGRDRHLLHHVHEPPLAGIDARAVDGHAADHGRDGVRPAAREPHGVERAAARRHERHARRDRRDEPGGEGQARAGASEDAAPREQAERGPDERDGPEPREREPDHEHAGPSPRRRLGGEEVHRRPRDRHARARPRT
jgi:hypothetical protein